MAAAEPLLAGTEPCTDWWDYDPAKGQIDAWPGEPKAADWGVFHGRVVLVDYSNPVDREIKQSAVKYGSSDLP